MAAAQNADTAAIYNAETASLQNIDLAGAHGVERRPMGGGRDARAAIRAHADAHLRAERLQKQRVGDDADVRTHADQLRLREFFFRNILCERDGAEAGLVEAGIPRRIQPVGDLPALLPTDAVRNGQRPPLPRGEIVLPVRIEREGNGAPRRAFAGVPRAPSIKSACISTTIRILSCPFCVILSSPRAARAFQSLPTISAL